MMNWKRLAATAALLATSGFAALDAAQTSGQKEEFTAIAIVNNNLASGAGTIIINVDRWSTDNEQKTLVETLTSKGPKELLSKLMDMRPTGTIRTPDSLGYDLRYAHQMPGKDGGRDIIIATDRPISFWEARNQPRTIDYPFTVIQMHFDRDGKGTGTLSYATKIEAVDNTIVLENFATAPVMLTEVRARTRT
jgi:hypothetical protein